MALEGVEPRLPVTIITGFLGSGKTTLVNHILSRQNGLRIAVMVNEIGEIAIDNDLIIAATDDMVELANGCICCSINSDLIDGIFRVLQREPSVDQLIVETTGIADPLPVMLTFLRSEFRDAVRVDGIVALADAENFSLDLLDSKAARNQLRYADFVVLNKCDLVNRERVEALEAEIRTAIGETVRILPATRAEVALPLILGIGTAHADQPLDDHGHDHLAADAFETVAFATEQAFCADRFQAFLERLPANLFRAKGVLTIDGSDRRHLFHLVGRRFTLDEAPAGLSGHNRLVLIGRNLNPEELKAQLAACLVRSVTPGLG